MRPSKRMSNKQIFAIIFLILVVLGLIIFAFRDILSDLLGIENFDTTGFNSQVVCYNSERTLMNSNDNIGTGTGVREIKGDKMTVSIKANLPDPQPTYTLTIPDICDCHCSSMSDCYCGSESGTCPFYKGYLKDSSGRMLCIGTLRRFRDGYYYLYSKYMSTKEFGNFNEICVVYEAMGEKYPVISGYFSNRSRINCS